MKQIHPPLRPSWSLPVRVERKMLWKIANGDWNDNELGACLAESVFEFALTRKPVERLRDACSKTDQTKLLKKVGRS